jgi:N-acetylglutamate synthase-like GNAT family acetyltransferase
MKQVWVRPLEERDLPKLADWITRIADKNILDPDVLKYPETTVLCAHTDKQRLFMPVQLAAMLESLAPAPDLTPMEFSECIKQLVKAVALAARGKGVHEVYFLCKDEDVVKLAKHHGFEELPYKTLRLKLDRIETQDEPKAN